MYDQNNSNTGGGYSGMMWMMIPCLLLFGFLFLGDGKLSSGEYFWPILIGVFVAAHIWMMWKGHGGHGGANTEDKIDDASTRESATKDEESKHKHSGDCH